MLVLWTNWSIWTRTLMLFPYYLVVMRLFSYAKPIRSNGLWLWPNEHTLSNATWKLLGGTQTRYFGRNLRCCLRDSEKRRVCALKNHALSGKIEKILGCFLSVLNRRRCRQLTRSHMSGRCVTFISSNFLIRKPNDNIPFLLFYKNRTFSRHKMYWYIKKYKKVK